LATVLKSNPKLLKSRYIPEPVIPAIPVPEPHPNTNSGGIDFMNPIIALSPIVPNIPMTVVARSDSEKPSPFSFPTMEAEK